MFITHPGVSCRCYTLFSMGVFHSRTVYITLALSAVGVVIAMTLSLHTPKPAPSITTVVERGLVEQLVSISGEIEADKVAELAFPVAGTVIAVSVAKGDTVATDEILVQLDSSALEADLASAEAALTRAIATYDELIAGASQSERLATAEKVALKQATLDTTRANQADLVAGAYRTLLTTDLVAISENPNEDAKPPVISGTYTCPEEGYYHLDTYASAGAAGFSFRLSGLETNTYTGAIDQPISFGECGLRIMFDAESKYNQSRWMIPIPNYHSAKYTTNRNDYELARTRASSAIAVATQDLVLAQADATEANAPARAEAVARAAADIMSARASIDRIKVQLDDLTLTAPFSGIVTEIDILPGETATTKSMVTVLATEAFDLTAYIPEIDIGKIAGNQPIRAVFDARPSETLVGRVDFISPQATTIDGVAYYEITITLETQPAWLRSGMSADIDIVTNSTESELRLPESFLSEEAGVTSVTVKRNNQIFSTPVELILRGDDGYAAVSGDLQAGDVIVKP